MRRHTYLSVGVAIGLSLALMVPNLANAGPVGELLGGAPVAGPIVDPDGDGNADLPVLSEDTCEGHDDAVDQDVDGIPDGCDSDRDGDGVENGADLWPDDPSQTIDSDGDGVSDERDACDGHDDAVDQDADRVPDACDSDRDGDGVENEDDLRPDDPSRWSDVDLDGVADEIDDLCLGYDDSIDQDVDGIPDGCDSDRDGDGVENDADLWPDDPSQTVDADGDGVSDERDACEGHDDAVDQDADRVPDGCDSDRDGDGVANGDDFRPDDPLRWSDADGDGLSDEQEDVCPGHDDKLDQDRDGTPDGCDSDRDGDAVGNAADLWPDDGARQVAVQAITAFTTQFRAGNGTMGQASELAVTSISPAQTVNGQHAWSSFESAPLTVEWAPSSMEVRLTVGTDVTTLAVTSVPDIRALQILLRSGRSWMTVVLRDLRVNGEALPTGPLSATNQTEIQSFGAVHWNQGFTLTGKVTFMYDQEVPGNNDLEVLVSLGR